MPMARARNIKPSLFKNELLGVADPMLTILFTSLWCLADKAGRLEDRPLRIKAETFPYRDNVNINGYLTELARLGFIHRYTVNNLALIEIINFTKHQNPHHTEKESEYPKYDAESTACVLTVNTPLNNGYTPADSLIPDSLNPIKPSCEKKPKKLSTGTKFDDFWNAWPKTQRKVGKAACLKKWKLKNLDDIADQIIQHVEDMKLTKQWQDGFEPAPATYINQERWQDGVVNNDQAQTASKPWFFSFAGIEDKARELGIVQIKNESPPEFKSRVFKAAGLTPEQYRKAKADYGK